MKSKNEILDQFGQLIIEDCFDPCLRNLEDLRKKENPPDLFRDYVNLFQSLDEIEFKTLKHYLKDSLGALMFNLFRVFEEHPEFKIIYEEENQQVNLVEISESLKAEPIIENGWIKRYSKQL